MADNLEPRVSPLFVSGWSPGPGDAPLTKEPVDSGYEIEWRKEGVSKVGPSGLWQARTRMTANTGVSSCCFNEPREIARVNIPRLDKKDRQAIFVLLRQVIKRNTILLCHLQSYSSIVLLPRAMVTS